MGNHGAQSAPWFPILLSARLPKWIYVVDRISLKQSLSLLISRGVMLLVPQIIK